MDEKTLEDFEPRVYRLFKNSLSKNRLANSYLLYGERNAPLKETALYLAESLGCEKGPFACRMCPSCRRFEKGISPDFVLIDGEENTIKKDDIKALEKKFSLSALEKGHRLTYVITRIENITEEASNALLKFLEEPKEGQVAFLTTYNPENVLLTIKSRSLLVRIDPLDQKALYQSLVGVSYKLGKKTYSISEGEAYYLSRFKSSKEEALALLTQDETLAFKTAYDGIESFFNALSVSFPQAESALMLLALSVKEASCYNWVYLLLDDIFTDILLHHVSADNPFLDGMKVLSRHPERVAQAESIVKEALALKQINLSFTLVLSRMLLALQS